MTGTHKWLNVLPKIVDTYNRKVHRTIGVRPIDVNNSKIERHLLATVYNYESKRRKKPKFRVGDKVRISKIRGVFDKSYHPGFSYEVFEVANVDESSNPVTYYLQDFNKQPILGRFYTEELKLTRVPDVYLVEKVLRKKNNQLYVKYLGFEKPEWIPKENLL
jgi:hypothetical protein